jgi:hypothetical protein
MYIMMTILSFVIHFKLFLTSFFLTFTNKMNIIRVCVIPGGNIMWFGQTIYFKCSKQVSVALIWDVSIALYNNGIIR